MRPGWEPGPGVPSAFSAPQPRPHCRLCQETWMCAHLLEGAVSGLDAWRVLCGGGAGLLSRSQGHLHFCLQTEFLSLTQHMFKRRGDMKAGRPHPTPRPDACFQVRASRVFREDAG